MRVPIVRGRGFVQADFGNAPPVALVTRETARRYWRDEDPIGRRIAFDGRRARVDRSGGRGRRRRNSTPARDRRRRCMCPAHGSPSDPPCSSCATPAKIRLQLAPTIRSELAQLDKTQPVYDVRSMQRVLVEDLGGTYSVHRHARCVCNRGAAARCCRRVRPCVVFGESAHARDRASHGARSKTGGNPWKVVARGSVPMTIGLVLGSAGAAGLLSVTSAALSGNRPRDPLAYVLVAVPLIVVALVATLHSRAPRDARRSAAGTAHGITTLVGGYARCSATRGSATGRVAPLRPTRRSHRVAGARARPRQPFQ